MTSQQVQSNTRSEHSRRATTYRQKLMEAQGSKQPYPRELYRVRQPVVAVCAAQESVRDALTSSLSIVEASAASQRDLDDGPDPQGVTRYVMGDLSFSLPTAKRSRAPGRPGTAGSVDDSGDEGTVPPSPGNESRPAWQESDNMQDAPGGIMKIAWMQKYQEVIPGVVVLALDFDVELSATGWSEMERKLCTSVETIRKNMGGRSEVPVFVLLLQERDYPQKMEVQDKIELAQGRIGLFCSAAGISRQDVMLVYTGDLGIAQGSGGKYHPDVSVLNVLYKRVQDLASSFYRTRIKRLKSQRKSLDRGSPQGSALWIRYNFKIAQHYEARQMLAKAAAHYQAAYECCVYMCKSILVSSSDMLLYSAHEIKSVAEIVHFRLVMIHTLNHEWVEAIQQFTRHIEIFSKLEGPPSLRFQHWEWMSRQHESFAQLVDDFRPTRTQIQQQERGNPSWSVKLSPAYYLELAAVYATIRRKCSQDCGVFGGTADHATRTDARNQAIVNLEQQHGIAISDSIYVGGDPQITLPALDPLAPPQQQQHEPTLATAKLKEFKDLRKQIIQLYWLRQEGLVNQSALALALLQEAHNLATAHARGRLQKALANPGQINAGVGTKAGPYLVPRRKDTGTRRDARALFGIATEYLHLGEIEKAVQLLWKSVERMSGEPWRDVIAPVLCSLFEALEHLNDEKVSEVLHNPHHIQESTETGKHCDGLALLTFLASATGCGNVIETDVAERTFHKLLVWRCVAAIRSPDGCFVGESETTKDGELMDTTYGNPMIYVQTSGLGELFRWQVLECNPSKVCVGECTSLHFAVQSTAICEVNVSQIKVCFSDSRYDTVASTTTTGSQFQFPAYTKKDECWLKFAVNLVAKNLGLQSRKNLVEIERQNRIEVVKLVYIVDVSRSMATDLNETTSSVQFHAPINSFTLETQSNVCVWQPRGYSSRNTSHAFFQVSPAPTSTSVAIEHAPTALVGESFDIQVIVTADTHDLHDVRVKLQCWPPPPTTSMPFLSVVSESELVANEDSPPLAFVKLPLGEDLQPSEMVPVGDGFVSANQSVAVNVRCDFKSLPYAMSSQMAQERSIVAFVHFSHDNKSSASVCARSKFKCGLPFTIHTCVTPVSGTGYHLDEAKHDQKYISGNMLHVGMSIECTGTLEGSEEIFLEDVRVEVNDAAAHLSQLVAPQHDSSQEGKVRIVQESIGPNEEYSIGFQVQPKLGHVGSIGRAALRWKRVGSKGEMVITYIPLPAIDAVTVPVDLKLELNPEGSGKLGFPVKFTAVLYNPEHTIHDVALQVINNYSCDETQFLMDGPTKCTCTLLPFQTRRVEWTLFPTRSGMLRLPKVVAHNNVLEHGVVAPVTGSDLFFVSP